MKQHPFTTLGVAVISLILTQGFIGCKPEPGKVTETETPKDLHFPLTDTIVNAFNAGRPSYDLAQKTVGNVEIVIKDDRIVLEHVADAANELYAYYLQVDKRESKLDPGKIGRCEVISTERQLIVNSLTSPRTMLFYVASDGLPWYAKEIKDLTSYGGYGLGLRKITLGSPADKAPYCKCVYPDTYAFHCNAGGSENINCATSNLDGSCRVSCNNKTYACCDMGQE